MGLIVAVAFWLFIAIKLGGSIGKSVGGEVNAYSEKQYTKRYREIGRKYTNVGYPVPYESEIHNQGEEVWAMYMAEINDLKKQYGKPI